MNMDTLKALDAQYTANLEPDAAAAYFNASVAVRSAVPRWRIKDLIYRSGSYPALVAGQASANDLVKGVCITAMAYLNDADFDNLDLDLPGVGEMFDALTQAGILSIDTHVAIDGLADATEPRWRQLGLYDGPVGDQQIIKVRQE